MRADPTATLTDTSIQVISEQAGGSVTSTSSAIASITNQFKATGIFFGIDGFGAALTAGDNYRIYNQADFLLLSAEL